MADLFDPNPAQRDPQDTEAFRLGASRIRSLKQTLQNLLALVFVDTAPTFASDTLPSSLLTTASLGSGINKDGSTPPKLQAKVDATTIDFDGSGNIRIKPKAVLVSSLQSIAATGATDVTVAHGLPSIPSLVRWVYVCQSTELGYAVNDEVDIDVANMTVVEGGTFYGYRPTTSQDATNVYITIPDGTIFFATRHNSGGVAPTFGQAITRSKWKLKAYAWTI